MIARTIQSLRSLLAGIYGTMKPNLMNSDLLHKKPKILSRMSIEETMYPQADGVPCAAMAEMRAKLFEVNPIINKLPNYPDLLQKVKSLLGYTESISWMTIRDVLVCHSQHQIPLPEGITDDIIESVDKLAAWQWGILYKVFVIYTNKFII